MRSTLLAAFALLSLSAVADGALGAAPIPHADDPAIFRHSRTVVMGDLRGVEGEKVDASLAWLRDRGKPDVAASLILAIRYNRSLTPRLSEVLSDLTGETDAESWFDWMLWQQQNPEIIAHPSFERIKLELLTRIDPEFIRFIPLSENAGIRFEEVVWGGVSVDGIPALDNPRLIAAKEADYLTPGELVFGVEIAGDARAYPLRILDWHEMFNDVVGGVPVSLAYCTLCGAGILFKTDVEGFDTPFTFGSSGFLFRSNKLMYDRQTDSLWNQFTGRPVSGPLAGSDVELEILPVAITSWRDWETRNPETRVLSLETGHVRDYTPGAPYGHYFNSPDLMFPALLEDERLSAKDLVFGVRTAGGAKAWPLPAFEGGRIIHDQVGLVDLVLIGETRTRTVRAYRSEGRRFTADDSSTTLLSDGQTWRMTENELIGSDGTKMPRIAGHVAYWFAWAGYLGDNSDLFGDNGDPGRKAN